MVGNGAQLIAMVGITLGRPRIVLRSGLIDSIFVFSFRPFGILVTF